MSQLAFAYGMRRFLTGCSLLPLQPHQQEDTVREPSSRSQTEEAAGAAAAAAAATASVQRLAFSVCGPGAQGRAWVPTPRVVRTGLVTQSCAGGLDVLGAILSCQSSLPWNQEEGPIPRDRLHLI